MVALDLQVTMKPSAAAFVGALAELGERSTDLRQPFDALADDLLRAQRARFSSRGDGAWPPLSVAYAERKAAEYPGRPVLERTGRLRADVAHARRTVGHLELVLRVASRVAGMHQRGTSRMPARPVVALTASDRERTTAVLRDHLARVAAAAAARIRRS